MISNIMWFPSTNYYLTTFEVQEIERLLECGETLKNIRQNFAINEEYMNHLYINWINKRKIREANNINGKEHKH